MSYLIYGLQPESHLKACNLHGFFSFFTFFFNSVIVKLVVYYYPFSDECH